MQNSKKTAEKLLKENELLKARIAYLEESSKEDYSAEERLIESEAFNREIVDNSFDCIKILDLEANLQFMSKGGQNLLEIKNIKDYIGKSWFDLFKGKDLELALNAVKKAKLGEIGRFKSCIPTENGKPMWWDAIVTTILDQHGKPVSILAISRDITEQTLAEKALRESRQKLISAQHLAHIGSWTYDIITKKTIWSDETFNIWGLDPSLGAPKYSELQKYIHKDDFDVFDKAVDEAIDFGKTYDLELRIRRPDGKDRTIIKKCEPKFDESGKVILLEGTNQDITARKNSELEIIKARELAEKREKEIAEKSKELELINKAIIKINNENNPDNIAQILAEAIYEENPNSMITVSLYEKESDSIQLKSMVGFNRFYEKIAATVGKDPRNIKFDAQKLEKLYSNSYRNGKLELLEGGLVKLMAGYFSKIQCQLAEKLMNIGAIYTAGFSSDRGMKGGVIILLTKDKIIKYNTAIETLIAQTSQVIQRRQAEIEIEIKSGELEKQFIKSEKQRVANLVILNDLNKTTKRLTLEMKEREKAEDQVKRDLLEKNTLLQELYHRTKNNMQVISSMMRLEARRSGSEVIKDSFREITSKINTMALVHQKLYQAKDLSRINLKDYIQDLVRLISRSYSLKASNISIQYELEDIFVLIDTVMPLGLVLNELITNVFKHAFPETRTGVLLISLKLDSKNQLNLMLSDNGIGIPENIDLRQSDSMGLQTMFSLIEHQLQGSVNYDSSEGLTWNIKLMKSPNRARV